MHDSATADAAEQGPAQAELGRRLDDIRARYPAADPPVVAEVVQAVLATMTGDLSAPEIRLLAEVEELGRTISRAREEVAALGVDDITDSHIPAASDELEAVVSHTATATDRILAVCETLDELADGLTKRGGPSRGDAATALRAATTEVYESCSFQDITGQRISKVVGALQAIDAKVARIMDSFGDRRRSPDLRRAEPRVTEPRPEDLLNGPQLPGAAMDQSDIDQLLASF
jgi:chemotaxis protein CheZ